MSRPTVRAAVTGLLVAVLHLLWPAAAGSALAARPAAAGTPGFCPDDSGVSVVVDFRELGGGRVVRCAPGSQRDGLAALRNAGFDVAGTARWGDSFVCRINGRPGVDREPCADTPPATAYWSYWHAENGGPWRYSQRGAVNRTPPQGSIDGWSFQLGVAEGESIAPGVAPLRVGTPAEPPAPGGGGSGGSGGSAPGAPPTPQPPVQDTPATGGDSGGAEPTGEPAATDPAPDEEPEEADETPPDESPTPSPDATPTGEPATGTATPSGQAAGADGDSDWAGEDSAYAEAETDGSSGPSPLTLGVLALLAVLGTGGIVTARRRRRAAAPADDA
ncbi:hypothetical protein [Streptomyces sp. NPDC049881]|uniref:hypothetical protein n=1 Tax=Streptomyces sp. NPDC049881 TaxID=3155778 RepID=UPI00341262BA